MAQSDLVGRARFELYTADPASFMARRTELVREAKSAGAKDEAKAIAGIRKPQRSAFILNRYAADEPDRVADLLQLGADLRRAERDLDGAALRELSTKRRRLVADIVRAAVELSDAAAASSAVQEELTATLNAAIADDRVATALTDSSLTQPAEWSGFGSGFSAGGPAQLSLVPDSPAPKQAETEPEKPAKTKPAAQDPDEDEPTEPAERESIEHPAPAASAKTRAPVQEPTSTPVPNPSRQDRQTRAAQARTDREAKLRGDAQEARERAESTRKKRDEAGAEAAAALAAADSAVAEAAESLRIQQENVDDLVADLERARKRLHTKESELHEAERVRRNAQLAADRIRRHLHSK